MTLQTSVSTAAGAIEMTPGINLVMEHPNGKETSVALVRHHDTEQYAVCMFDFRRKVVSAPHYTSGVAGIRLASALSADGVGKVLAWTERQTALDRFASLVYETAAPEARSNQP